MSQNRRRQVLLTAGALLVAPRLAIAQQPSARTTRIGFMSPASAATYGKQLDVLKAGLRDLGHIEGKNIVFEVRWAEGRNDRLPDLAAELVGRKVDVIVTHGTPGGRAAKQATATIPIVCGAMADPVASGLVASFARPGANITGLAIFSQELYVKRLALLKEALPRIKRIAFLMNPENPVYEPIFHSMEIAAKPLAVELQRFDLRGPNDLNGAFAAMAKGRIDAVEIVEDGAYYAYIKAIADLATKQRLPSITSSEFAEAGCLIGYGVNRANLFLRVASYVDKILKGAKPGDLPIEQPTKFDFVINMKTAKALGITIPKSVLLRADRVIE